MTAEEAKRIQDDIAARGFRLGWWYGTRCERCCGVYPKFMKEGGTAGGKCYYQCEVCGTRTDGYDMPWQAEEAWNRHEYQIRQITFY